MRRTPRRAHRALAPGRVFLAIALIAAAAVPGQTPAATFTWTGARANGSWSSQFFGFTNWSGNLIPPSDATTELTFTTAAPSLVLNNDLAGPSPLNRLVFGGDPFTLTGGALQFPANGATAPTIQVDTATQPQINAAM